jgi:hypothetical protein
MLLSITLAHTWGIFLFLTCFGLLLNRETFIAAMKKMDTSSLFLAGFILLGVGSAQVVGYENWSISWMGLITLLGWALLAKGIAIFFLPGYSDKFLKLATKDNAYTIFIVVGLVIGIFLLTIDYINY